MLRADLGMKLRSEFNAKVYGLFAIMSRIAQGW